jgi:hypothetical protein
VVVRRYRLRVAVTSSAFLSSLHPKKVVCRNCSSSVHSANAASHTSITTDLNTGDWSDDLLQPFPSLQDGFAGNVTPITPKQIEQIIGQAERSGVSAIVEVIETLVCRPYPTQRFHHLRLLNADSAD